MSKGIVDQINKKKCGTGQHLNLLIFLIVLLVYDFLLNLNHRIILILKTLN